VGRGGGAAICFATGVDRLKRLVRGGSAGNEQLTAFVAAVLLVLLAVEGATLLQIRSLLTVHAFVGMLLIPIVVLKLASTGWRKLRYYLGGEEYVRRGPPHVVLRALVAPVMMLSTVVVFATGVALLVLDRTQGTLVALHQASFVVWFVATSLHVLAHVWRLPRLIRWRLPGAAPRIAVVALAVVAGAALATATLPGADRLQDRATARLGIDAG
jgi:hypothetical protein